MLKFNPNAKLNEHPLGECPRLLFGPEDWDHWESPEEYAAREKEASEDHQEWHLVYQALPWWRRFLISW